MTTVFSNGDDDETRRSWRGSTKSRQAESEFGGCRFTREKTALDRKMRTLPDASV
jgi:hypothetical protein